MMPIGLSNPAAHGLVIGCSAIIKTQQKIRIKPIGVNLILLVRVKPFFMTIPGQLHTHKKLEAPAKKGEKHYKGKIAKEAMPINIPEYQYHQNGEGGDDHRLYVKFVISFCDQEDDRGRKIKTFLHRKRPALGYAGIPKLVKKAAQKSDIQQHHRNWVSAAFGNTLIARDKKIYKGCYRQQKIHGVNAGHPVFEVLLKPVAL